jgi:protein-disulfide isomerase
VRATARAARVRLPKSGDKDSTARQELSLTLTRRELFKATAVFVLVEAAPLGAAVQYLTTTAKADDTPSPGDLATAGPDGDVVLGSNKAPVTVIEYASMTCPHCARFSATTFPELKQRYIETGKVRFIMREFPLDAVAASGFMLARCAGNDNDKYMAIVETLFARQSEWMVREPLPPLKSIAKQFGFTEDSFNQCLANQKLLDDIQGVRDHAVKKLGVKSTPTFFINGKKLLGDVSIEAMAKEIDPYLKDGS